MAKTVRTEFGRELAKLRIDFDENGQEMAKKLGMSGSNLHAIEMGKVQTGLDLIEKIKTLYGKNLEDVFVRGGGLTKLELDLTRLDSSMKDIAVGVWKVGQGILTTEEFLSQFDDFAVPVEPDVQTVATTTDTPAPAAPTEGKKSGSGWRPPPVPDDVAFLTEEELSGLDDL